MLDRYLIPVLEPVLDPAGKAFAAKSISPDWIYLGAFAVGLVAAAFAGIGLYSIALWLVLLNRLMDGIGDAAARAGGISDFGRYLDIVMNFIFYGVFVLGFAFADTSAALATAILMFALLGLGGTVLAYAVVAAGRGMGADDSGNPVVDILSELIGTTETAVVLVLMCLFPEYFAAIALMFALVALATTLFRVIRAWMVFR